MIRFLLCAIELLIFVIIMLILLLVALLIRAGSKKQAHRFVQACLRIEFRVIMWLTGCRVSVNGLENIPVMAEDGMSEEACLFVANHRSIFDIVMAYGYTKQILAFVAKKEAADIPVLGWMMALMNGIFLDRKDLRQGLESINKAQSLIRDDGISVWIFPEGTRSKGTDEKELLEFHAGSFRVATKTGAPIVPVFISGTRNIMARHIPFIKACDVSITYGTPVWPDAMEDEHRKHIADYFRNMIITMGQK